MSGMKLYTSLGPNPAIVQAFLLQRGAEIETVMLDITRAEARGEPYIRWNPAGTLPLLEIGNGHFIAESLAICEYIDEVLDGPSLIGNSPEARADTRMWLRRIDLAYVQPASSGWRFAEGLEMCRPIMYVIPHAADDFKAIAAQGLVWLDRHLGDRLFIGGAAPSLADISLFVFVEFGDAQGQPVAPDLPWVAAWRERMKGFPLAGALGQRAA